MAKGSHPARRRIPDILSSANPLLKAFRRALAEGVSRQDWLAVEGPFLVEEALRARESAHIHSVLVSEEGLERLKTLVERLPADAEVARVSDALFRRVAETENPQGIAALVELKRPTLESILREPQVLLVIACGLQDPGNLGTIHRSAQAFGASALVTLEATVSPFNPKAMRASAGAVFHVPSFAGADPGALFTKLRAARVRMIAADPHSPKRVSDADLRGPLAILIGQEAAGLSPEIASQADLRLSVPLRAGMDSLNAATAASIFLYEAARQRNFQR
jgi:TrmH family RNA methyltransferase